MQRRHLALFLALASACAPSSDDYTVSHTETIVGGDPVSNDELATVVVYNSRQGGLCTGTLISPRVVLTAKHCIQGSGQPDVYPASWVLIGVGDSLNRTSQVLQVQSIVTTPGVWQDGPSLSSLVGVDVALVTLVRGPSGVTPVEVERGDPSVYRGQQVKAVGFGQTPSGTTGVKYRTTTRVSMVDRSLIWTPPSTCQGDSGGPLFTPEGKVFGVTSFGFGGQCGAGAAAFNRIDIFLDMIDTAIGESGACLNDGAERCDGFDNDCNDLVDEGCLDLGSECTDDSVCLGTTCRDTSEGRICTQECDPTRPFAGCPENMYCSQEGANCQGYCVPGAPQEGALGFGEPCDSDTQCNTLFCTDPGDGSRRCLIPCKGDAGACLAGEVCAVAPGQCGGCVDASIVVGARGLGEDCTTSEECGSGLCLSDPDTPYCSRDCASDADCGQGFHCRGEQNVCIRGSREGVGTPCSANGDCHGGGFCAQQSGRSWCTDFCTDSCPDGFNCTPVGDVSVCAPDLGLIDDDCGGNEECVTGLCVGTPDGSVCSRLCGRDVTCGPGFECRSAGDGQNAVCLSTASGNDNSDGGGDAGDSDDCSVSQVGRGGPAPWAAMLSLFGLIALRRRR